MRERSQRGQAATGHERELIAAVDLAEIGDPLWQWVVLAQKVGIDPILAVLDAFGGEKIKIISRRGLFEALARPAEDRIIATRYRAGDPVCDIAAHLGVSRRRVYRSLRRLGVTPHTANAVKATG